MLLAGTGLEASRGANGNYSLAGQHRRCAGAGRGVDFRQGAGLDH